MKLSKQERIAALVILALVILAVGAFMLVKPKFEEVGRTKETLAQRQNELDAAKQRQQLKATLRTQIEQEYEEGEHLADMFFPELASYEADMAFSEFVKQLDFPFVAEEIEVEEPAADTLSVNFYEPVEVEYDLKTYVTQNIDPTEEEIKVAQRNQALQEALSSQQTIGASKVSFKGSVLTREDFLKLLDAINDYEVDSEDDKNSGKIRKAICVDSAEFDFGDVVEFYNILAGQSTAEMSRAGRDILRGLGFTSVGEEEGDGTQTDEPQEFEIYYIHNIEGSVIFYSIERMQDPKAQLDAQDGVVTPAA